MKTTLSFGIDRHSISIQMELKEKNNNVAPYLDTNLKECKKYKELTITGDVFGLDKDGRKLWNSSGQCQDLIRDVATKHSHKILIEICDIWDRCHLGGLTAGTTKQQELIKTLSIYDYDKACKLLQEKDLYIDRGYKYGTACLVKRLSKKDITQISKFFSI